MKRKTQIVTIFLIINFRRNKMSFSEKFSLTLTIIGTALSAIGIMLTIKSTKDAKKLKTISWEQLQSACKDIAKHIKHQHFSPDIIVTPGQKGGIIAQMIMDILDIEIPIYTGFLLNYPSHSEKNGRGFLGAYP